MYYGIYFQVTELCDLLYFFGKWCFRKSPRSSHHTWSRIKGRERDVSFKIFIMSGAWQFLDIYIVSLGLSWSVQNL